jgi:ABC-2 type transport system permease protein
MSYLRHYIWPVFRREFAAYFATPIAFVFLAVFLVSMGVFTFYVGHFFETGIANLVIFFSYQPWLYLFLLPALAMRLWAEEKRSGSIELLLTLPLPVWATVLGKYLAAWAFAGLALLLTFPVWITVNYLGSPDNGVILASYIGSFIMAGAYLAIGAAISAATANQVIAFVVAVVVCFLFTAAGAPLVMENFAGWAPLPLVETVASFSFLQHFDAITEGVIDLRDLIFFASLIGLSLFANVLLIETGKGG